MLLYFLIKTKKMVVVKKENPDKAPVKSVAISTLTPTEVFYYGHQTFDDALKNDDGATFWIVVNKNPDGKVDILSIDGKVYAKRDSDHRVVKVNAEIQVSEIV